MRDEHVAAIAAPIILVVLVVVARAAGGCRLRPRSAGDDLASAGTRRNSSAAQRRPAVFGQLDAVLAALSAALADQSVGARILPDRKARAGTAPRVHDVLAAAWPVGDPL